MPQVVVSIDLDAPADRVWHAVVDWEQQSRWMLATDVRPAEGDGHGADAVLSARTGLGPVGFTDPMTIVEWDPPQVCVVRHDGRLVRGSGTFRVVDLGDDRACFVWSEDLQLPLGVLGRVGWPVVRPLALAGMALSLRRLAAYVEGHR